MRKLKISRGQAAENRKPRASGKPKRSTERRNGKEVMEMKIQVTTSEILTVYQLKKLIRELRGLEKTEHSGMEIELQAEVLSESLNMDFVDAHNMTPEERRELVKMITD